MQLTDILHPDCIKVPLEAKDKQAAIFELVGLLCDHTGIADRSALEEAVWQRELTRTTGIGHGVAIPHGKIEACRELVLAVGRAAEPIEFGAIDNRPVELIFLLVSPADQTGPHIQALASISRLLTAPDVRKTMSEAPSAEALYRLIRESESEQARE